MAEQCCNNCKWAEPSEGPFYLKCIAPLPKWVVVNAVACDPYVTRKWGASCPTFAQKAESEASNDQG